MFDDFLKNTGLDSLGNLNSAGIFNWLIFLASGIVAGLFGTKLSGSLAVGFLAGFLWLAVWLVVGHFANR